MEPFALKRALDNVRATTPLVHNITNYVTVNDCANALLAIGASPIMSDEPADVEDITSICGGLTLNIGTLNERSIEGMFAAGERASELGHAIVLDPVGAGASALRTRVAGDLLDKLAVSVIRGNMSEMKALAGGAAATRGVDVCPDDAVTEDNLAAGAAFARDFAAKTRFWSRRWPQSPAWASRASRRKPAWGAWTATGRSAPTSWTRCTTSMATRSRRARRLKSWRSRRKRKEGRCSHVRICAAHWRCMR